MQYFFQCYHATTFHKKSLLVIFIVVNTEICERIYSHVVLLLYVYRKKYYMSISIRGDERAYNKNASASHVRVHK